MKKLAILLAALMTLGTSSAFAQCSPTGPCADGDLPDSFYIRVKRVIVRLLTPEKKTTSTKQDDDKTTQNTKTETNTSKEKENQEHVPSGRIGNPATGNQTR